MANLHQPDAQSPRPMPSRPIPSPDLIARIDDLRSLGVAIGAGVDRPAPSGADGASESPPPSEETAPQVIRQFEQSSFAFGQIILGVRLRLLSLLLLSLLLLLFLPLLVFALEPFGRQRRAIA